MSERLANIGSLLGLRALGIALQLLVQVLVGRLLGPAGLGLVQVFITWTCVLGEVVASGRPAHSMKTLAVARTRYSAAQARAYLRDHLRGAGVLWLVLVGAAMPLLWFPGLENNTLLLMVLATLCFALLRIAADAAKAMSHPRLAVFLECLLPPLVVLSFGTLLWMRGSSSAAGVMLAYVLGLGVAALTLAVLLLRSLHGCRGEASAAPRASSTELLPLWGAGLLSILFVQFPFLVMPIYSDADDIGLFALAFKVVSVVATVLTVLSSLYGPRFARAWAQADIPGLHGLLGETRLVALLLFVPQALVLWLFAEPALAWFGVGFEDAIPLLWILLLGQLANAATGLPGLLLNMAGAGRQECACLALTLVLALLAALLLGPSAGATGMAVVYSGALLFKNLASLAVARRLLQPAPAGPLEIKV